MDARGIPILDREREYLGVSLDQDRDGAPEVVLLYVPEKDEFRHYHIELTDSEVKTLHAWLGEYLERI